MSLSLLRPARRPAVVLLTALLASTGLLVAGTGVASAHVTVSSGDAAPGGYGKLTFRVPNESDTASTVGLRVQVPTDTPLTSLRAQPVPGWTVSMTEAQLPEPVEVHGEPVEQAVSVVEFRAEEGQGIDPGEFQEFALSGGPFPETDELTFNAVQTYSDGTEAAWIEPTVDGQPEPRYPSPVLSLAAEDADTPTDTAATADPAADDEGSDGTAVTALVLAVLGLLAGLGGLFLGLSARRRTVSS
ncbi:YcnI family protein [Modestobacter sp. VKM Ac-2979]|uniref:YcnI family copper-binding membrane protein n=1 Tax=unclassified Modestobacter TaxID=2643866 RepID=UPI0022AB725D|nr:MULTISPECIES: YcnI family protein [unclassified Modestobacter]MCZ2810135.1 YcnI family protein [Modestobacter sp. VKM Ac-2979]MCZ2841621.1 YcnI family protein [Modestobacter sp. VKM Ac-2980]